MLSVLCGGDKVLVRIGVTQCNATGVARPSSVTKGSACALMTNHVRLSRPSVMIVTVIPVEHPPGTIVKTSSYVQFVKVIGP